MFSLVKGFLDMYFEVSSYKMLIIGEESSGKTVCLVTHYNINIIYKYKDIF